MHFCIDIKGIVMYFIFRELQTAPTSSSGHSEQERKLVDEITAPGGVRTAPTREAMTTFINRYVTCIIHMLLNVFPL